LADELIHFKNLRVTHRLIALQSRQIDHVVYQMRQASGFYLHTLGELTHSIRLITCRENCFREKRKSTYRSLQLVTHVCHEVTANGFDSALVSQVFDNHQKSALSQQSDLRPNVQLASTKRRTWHSHFALARVAVAADQITQVSNLGNGYAISTS
jgi:hypothetical protein